MLDLLDIATLTVDLPLHNLQKGQHGTIVEILNNGTAFKVEFSDPNGKTIKTLGLWHYQLSKSC